MYRKQMLRSFLQNEATKESVVAFSKSTNLKHCCYIAADACENLTMENLRNAWNKLWIFSKELENEKDTDQNNISSI